MEKINQYRITSRLYESARTLVLQASDPGGEPVILKLAKSRTDNRKERNLY